jgi:hypothetical protein
MVGRNASDGIATCKAVRAISAASDPFRTAVRSNMRYQLKEEDDV